VVQMDTLHIIILLNGDASPALYSNTTMEQSVCASSMKCGMELLASNNALLISSLTAQLVLAASLINCGIHKALSVKVFAHKDTVM
jgi:hypothetical protein